MQALHNTWNLHTCWLWLFCHLNCISFCCTCTTKAEQLINASAKLGAVLYCTDCNKTILLVKFWITLLPDKSLKNGCTNLSNTVGQNYSCSIWNRGGKSVFNYPCSSIPWSSLNTDPYKTKIAYIVFSMWMACCAEYNAGLAGCALCKRRNGDLRHPTWDTSIHGAFRRYWVGFANYDEWWLFQECDFDMEFLRHTLRRNL